MHVYRDPVQFNTHGISYSNICGKEMAYQFGSVDAFRQFGWGENAIDSNYVDNVSLTMEVVPGSTFGAFQLP